MCGDVVEVEVVEVAVVEVVPSSRSRWFYR